MRFRHKRRSNRVDHPVPVETEYLVSSGNGEPFTVMVEPEAMEYEFPPHEKVLLTMRPRRHATQHLELIHYSNHLTIWRPGDTEVWATTADGETTQIGGWAHVPAPWLGSGSSLPPETAPWTWPRAPSPATDYESKSDESAVLGVREVPPGCPG